MALLRPREITQIVRVGLGFEACFSCLRIPVSLCPGSHLLSQGLGTWGLSDFLGYPGHGFFFLSYTFSLPLPAICSPRMPTGQSRRESALSVSLNTSWEASQSIVSFCFLVIHLLPVPSSPTPSSSNSLPFPLTSLFIWNPKMWGPSNRVSAEVIDSSHREFSCL